MRCLRIYITTILIIDAFVSFAQQVSKTWVADLGNGMYKNPLLHADYSDPDVCRVGKDYYMTASSFDAVPGLPILHSNDLVNWTIVGHALKRQVPVAHFEKTQHGNGVWAPAIRFHNDEFYIYYPDPDFGIYLTKSQHAAGPWSEPVLVEAGKGLIDPCPLWDEDGSNYLVHAYAGSRAGIKSILVIKQLNAAGDKTIDEGKIIYDGHELDPTIEGPKIYKRNQYYYIFAPAGGVSTGWQLVLRSKNIYGPYDRKVVMDQGTTSVNGPHQGAWVDTVTDENWFIHFQDKEAYGRVVHLQPMQWIKDWPVIGEDADHDGKGQPVLRYRKPNVGKVYSVSTPPESDEFNSNALGLQWQWQANPQSTWSFTNMAKGTLRLYAKQTSSETGNLWDVPNVLLQKFPAEEFVVQTKLHFAANTKAVGERVGLVVMGQDYMAMGLKSTPDGLVLFSASCSNAMKGTPETEQIIKPWNSNMIYLKIVIAKGAVCRFLYSGDGDKFTEAGTTFNAQPGRWIGAKVGLFCTAQGSTNDAGYADIDWFRISDK